MAESFNLHNALVAQNEYLNRKYTSAENGRAAMEQRELQNAEKAIEAQNGFLSLTLSEKIKDIMVPERVLQEFSDVAVNTLMGAIDPFLQWLEENEVYYNENLFKNAIQADAKQMFYTNLALAKEASNNEAGQNFVYDM